MVQWLRHCASPARGRGFIPGQGTKIPHASRYGQKLKKKKGGGGLSEYIWHQAKFTTLAFFCFLFFLDVFIYN